MPDIFAPSYGPRPGAGESPFLQGLVEAWDAVAGTNAVRVRGQRMENLQTMIGSESGLMRAGDSVVVAKLNNTYAVFGRLDALGAEQRALGIVTDREPTQVDWSTSSGATFFTLAGGPAVSVYIGSARRCRVDLTAWMSAYAGDILAGFTVSGASNIAADYTKALWLGCSQLAGDSPVQPYGASTRTVYLSAADGLNEGTNVFTMVYRTGIEFAGGGGSISDREITVQPF
jgi:hypothetical protein